MARKGRRAPPKRAAATATEPSPAPDVDSDNSATAPLETVATSPADPGRSQLSIEPKHEDLGADDDEKMASLSDDHSRALSMADDDALTKEANGAGVSQELSSGQPTQAPWQAGSSEISHFPAGFSLPPIPSTSSAVLPARTDYTPEEIAAWRERQTDAKQAELTAVVDKHDDYVRELFHLDRFVTLIGFDPAVAKADRSDVFQLFQANYDLFLNAASDGASGSSGRRGTRRATTDRKVSALAAGAEIASGRKKGKAKAEGEDEEMWSVYDENGRTGPKKKGLGSARGKKASGSPSSPGVGGSPSPAPSVSRYKKRPSHVSTTPSRSGSQAPYLFPVPPEGQAVYEPVVANMDELPNMLKDDLPPLSPRAVKRRKILLESGVTYTHPMQIPPDPQFDFSLARLLESYVSLDDDVDIEPPPTEEELDQRAEYELDILDQVEAIRAEGRELYNPDRTAEDEPKRAKDHQDWLVEHALHFSHLVAQERKAHVALARKTARMVTKHFDEIRGKEEKEQKEIERNQKALARWTIREVRKKWKLAAGVVRARFKEEQKAEQKRLGKQQLDLMLNKSTTMLQAQQLEMAGEESSDENPGVSDDESEGEEEDEEGEAEEASESEAESEDAAASETASEASPAPSRSARTNARRTTGRSRLSVSATPADTPLTGEDDDADDSGDAVFAGATESDAERDAEDNQFAAEMEEDDAGGGDDDDDDEMANLAAEADMPIEELLRRSGYAAMVAEEEAGTASNGPSPVTAPTEPAAPVAESTETSNGETSNAAPSPSTPGTSAPAGPELTAEEKEAEAMSEFGSAAGEEGRDQEDEQLEQEMEADEGESDDEEMKGLAEDADLPIEELMRKYGYGPNADAAASPADADADAANSEMKVEPDDAASESVKSEAPSAHASDAEDAEEIEEIASDAVAAEKAARETGLGADRQVVHFKPPFLLRATLRPYQQAGLEWLASLYTSGVNGILADEMGLGKTIQTIALLAHLACDKGQWGPHLVVVPTSVMLNWEMEFRKFLPGFKLLTYYGTQKERKEKRKGWNTENAFHVCITSYQLVLADQYIFRRKPWHYLILDEAHHIKNFRSQRWQTLLGFNARHRLLLTGTPLQNNLMELWSLLYFLMPQGLAADGSGPFAEHSDFQAWFSNPMDRAIESGEVMDAETQATVNQLHTILRPYLLRRLKAEVETQMPGKTESVIYCRMSKRQRYLYDDFMSRAQTRDTLSSGHFLSIINCLMQLRKVCNHPDLFEVRPIVTSFSMQRSVVSNFEPAELLVRKRLIEESPIAKMDWSTLTLVKPWQEETTTTVASQVRMTLDASAAFPYLHQVPVDVDLYNAPPRDTKSIAGWTRYHSWFEHRATLARLDRLATINRRRCIASTPYFGADLLRILREPGRRATLFPSDTPGLTRDADFRATSLTNMVLSHDQRAATLDDTISTFAFATPAVRAHDMAHHALPGMTQDDIDDIEEEAPAELLHLPSTKLTVAFPDRSLLQYDCGKLQKLDELLRECKTGGHRALIFTQMTKVLDILEEFLSYQGYRYLRLDGSTKIEQRQALTERFNSNDKILCFISSTRAGGLGINLQGADTVIFYDSDWNPALDRQCQDRAHRIGQTREVRIWRFVTEHSIEENMLRKANQKRKLDQMVIAEGDFTTDHLQRLDWRDYLDENQLADLGVDATAGDEGDTGAGKGAAQSAAEIRQALAAAEDVEDAAAAKAAINELEVDRGDFAGEGQQASGSAATFGKDGLVNTAADGQKEEEEDPLAGTVDGVMINWVEEDWDYFRDA